MCRTMLFSGIKEPGRTVLMQKSDLEALFWKFVK